MLSVLVKTVPRRPPWASLSRGAATRTFLGGLREASTRGCPIGFIGVGNMGSGMVTNLVEKGFKVHVFDMERTRALDLAKKVKAEQGSITVVSDITEVAAACEVVLASLPNEDAGDKAFFGGSGLMSARGSRVKTVIDHGTVSSQFSKSTFERFRAQHVDYLDAPVSGGPEGAAMGTLSIMVGGSKQTYEMYLPVLEAMGAFVAHMGPSGAGTAAKLVNQLLTGIHIMAASEGYALAKALGIKDTKALLELLSRSWGNSTILQRCGSFLALAEERGFDEVLAHGGAPIRNLNKDFKMIQSALSTAGLHLKLTDLTQEQMSKAVAMGLSDYDIAALVRVISRKS